VLRACRRILRPGGRLAFLTIEPTPGLTSAERRRAHRLGPQGVAVPTSYPSLLRTAGFVDIVATDLTEDYRRTLQRWIDASDRHEAELRHIVGDDAYAERERTRNKTVEAIAGGFLSRFGYTAVRRGHERLDRRYLERR
jgi:cyclopropane fatty-acyl-phospholipid synthase-like methyltransferase